MKITLLTAVTAICCLNAPAVIRYVDVNNSAPAAPYTDWATAATVIQDAINAAEPGDVVLVTNGVYQTGGDFFNSWPGWGAKARIYVGKPITVQSVNGPDVTIILGIPQSGPTNGVRCAYLTNNAVLMGFTLTNGSTDQGPLDLQPEGGAVRCQSTSAIVSNCVLISSVAAGSGSDSSGGGAYLGTFKNCTIANCRSVNGGGAYRSILTDCLLKNNSAYKGGGVYECIITNCMFTGNSAQQGGGLYGNFGAAFIKSDLVIEGCLFTNNSAVDGGAIYTFGSPPQQIANSRLTGNRATGKGGGVQGYSLVRNCVLEFNSATDGGGANGANLVNCLIKDNLATNEGGGTYTCNVTNCTIVHNNAMSRFGGVSGGTWVLNSIIYFNTAPSAANGSGGVRSCCITPNTGSLLNITNPPLFVDEINGNFRLQSQSPCINAGENMPGIPALDLDGNPRIVGGTPDVGAYEFQSPTSIISYGWLQNYGLPIDGSQDYVDADGDGANTWQEWQAGTNPTNALSVFHMLPLERDASGITVRWSASSYYRYFVQKSTNLGGSPAFFTIATNLGSTSLLTFVDTNAPEDQPAFYRVGRQP